MTSLLANQSATGNRAGDDDKNLITLSEIPR
jgi:hypothetical protein